MSDAISLVAGNEVGDRCRRAADRIACSRQLKMLTPGARVGKGDRACVIRPDDIARNDVVTRAGILDINAVSVVPGK